MNICLVRSAHGMASIPILRVDSGRARGERRADQDGARKEGVEGRVDRRRPPYAPRGSLTSSFMAPLVVSATSPARTLKRAFEHRLSAKALAYPDSRHQLSPEFGNRSHVRTRHAASQSSAVADDPYVFEPLSVCIEVWGVIGEPRGEEVSVPARGGNSRAFELRRPSPILTDVSQTSRRRGWPSTGWTSVSSSASF